MVITRDLNKELEVYETKNEILAKKLVECQEWVDTRLKLQVNLYNKLVSQYYRKMAKCEAYQKQLELSYNENERFKSVVRRLTAKIEELLTRHSIDDKLICPVPFAGGCEGDDGCNDAVRLEECAKKLVDELNAFTIRTENVSRKLVNDKALLAESVNVEDQLREQLKVLIATVGNPAQAESWDRDEVEMRATVGRISDELINVSETNVQGLRLTIKQRDVVFDEKVVQTMDGAMDTIKRVSGLLTDNARLMAEVEENRAVAETLGVKLIELQSADSKRVILTTLTKGENLHPQQCRSENLQSCSVDDYNNLSDPCTTSPVSSCGTLVYDCSGTNGRTRPISPCSLSINGSHTNYDNNDDCQQTPSSEPISVCF